MYYNGEGVEQDYCEAFRWLKKSAEQGDEDAQYKIGVMYHNGIGVEKDEEAAMEWLKVSSDNGNSNAREYLDSLRKEEERIRNTNAKAYITIIRTARFTGSARTVVIEIDGYKYYISNKDSYKEITVSANTEHTLGFGYKNLFDNGDDIKAENRVSRFFSEGDRLTIDVTIDREKYYFNGIEL